MLGGCVCVDATQSQVPPILGGRFNIHLEQNPVIFFVFTECLRATLFQGSNFKPHVQRAQVSVVRVPDAMLLHCLRHDGGGAHPEPAAGGSGQQHLLQHMEPVQHLPHPAPGVSCLRASEQRVDTIYPAEGSIID